MKKIVLLLISFLSVTCYIQAQIIELQAKTDLDEAFQNGTLHLQIRLAEQKYKATALHYKLIDPKGRIVAKATLPVHKKQWNLDFATQTIQQPLLWNAECPTLYTLEVNLQKKNGITLDQKIQKIAFRNILMNEKGMYVNGKLTRVKGINIRSIASLDNQQDLKPILKKWKEYHINAIRISEATNNHQLTNLCNEYGFYIFNEAEGFDPTHTALREGCLWDWPNEDLPVKLEEMKKLYQDIRFYDFNKETGTVSIENLHTFTDLDQFDFYYLVRDHGKEVYRAPLPGVKAAPGKSFVCQGLKGYTQDRKTTGDVRIEFYATYRMNQPLQQKGSLAAREQTYIHTFYRPIPNKSAPKILLEKATETSETLTLEGEELQIVFNKKSGQIISYIYQGEEYLSNQQGLHPFFWRAPTQNDKIAQFPQVLKPWKEASYQSLMPTSFQYTRGKEEMAIVKATYRFPQTDAQWDITYKIYSDGIIKVNNRFVAEGNQAPMIPRVGLRMQLNPLFTTVNYFGRGPRTNYRDCRIAQFLGEYSSPINATHETCQHLQENNHRTDIYWCAIQGKLKGGLLLVADRTFEMNISNQILEDLEQGIRQTQDKVDLFVDYRMMGIGADNRKGTPTQEPYLIRPGKNNTIEYGFTMIPFSNNTNYKKLILKY